MDSGLRERSRVDPVVALRRLGSVATAKELRAASDPWAIRKAVAAGQIERIGPRRYALPGLEEARAAAARLGGVTAGLSAAAYWGWKVKEPARRPCVQLRRGMHRDPNTYGDVEVRWGALPPAEVHEGIVTSPLRTVVDCLRWLPEDEGLAVADSALRSGRVRKQELLDAVARSPRTGRSRAQRLARLADARAANPFESVLRWIASTVPGLEVEPQGAVDGIGHGDLVDKRLRLVIEAESWAFHSEKDAFRYDCRRYTAMVRAAWRVVRFVHEDVMRRQMYVREVLVDLVALGPQAPYGSYVPGVDRRVMGGV